MTAVLTLWALWFGFTWNPAGWRILTLRRSSKRFRRLAGTLFKLDQPIQATDGLRCRLWWELMEAARLCDRVADELVTS